MTADPVAELIARLASAARFDDIVKAVLHGTAQLGFGGVWVAVLDEDSGMLSTLVQVIDGVDTTHEVPVQYSLDLRLPIGRAFRDHKMLNVIDPSSVIPLDSDDDRIRAGKLALPRVTYDQLRGRPFASGPLLGSRDQPVGALGLASYLGHQPIPDEVLSGSALRAFMDHLGIAVERALRVEQLEAKLRKAQDTILSDARVKATGERALAIAHDLNNLSVIALLAAAIGQRSAMDAVNVLPRIERVNRAMSELVARLQRIARPSAGAAEVCDVKQTVDDLLVMVEPLQRERSIAITADVPAVPLVRCDSVLLHRVLLNLLANAHDALDDVARDQRRIELAVRDDGEVVRLTIADSGPGIAPAILPRLFQPFSSTKRNEHLGLGLAESRTSLDQFGARLDGRNRASGGAVFEVTLRAVAPDRSTPAAPAVADQTRGARILAVDDEPDVVQLIREFLEPMGYHIETATDAEQAIEATKSQPFDVVLCDLGMPKHGGLDVCDLLREAGYHGKLVLMTGRDTHSMASKPLPARSDALLKKPFLGAELIGAIEGVLPSPGLAHGPAPGAPDSPAQ